VNNTNNINHRSWCSFSVTDCCFIAQRGDLAWHGFNMMSHPTMAMAILVQQWANFDQKILYYGVGSMLNVGITRMWKYFSWDFCYAHNYGHCHCLQAHFWFSVSAM
jgi:hypothetical protein